MMLSPSVIPRLQRTDPKSIINMLVLPLSMHFSGDFGKGNILWSLLEYFVGLG